MAITIYTKPAGCFQCSKTIEKFEDAGLTPKTVDITTDDAALEYITEELGYAAVPVVVYEKDGTENHWAGLNPGKIKQVIDLDRKGA